MEYVAEHGYREERIVSSMAKPVDILGVPIHRVTWMSLKERVYQTIAQDGRLTIMYANVHVINQVRANSALSEALQSADIVYCDGEGVRVAARLLGDSLPARMTGADFIWDVGALLGEMKRSIYWLGGAPGVAEAAMATLAEASPGLSIAGASDGFFDKDGAGNEKAIARINGCQPAIVFVGMGTPIQETWVAQNRAKIDAPIVWCIGATADFIAGVQVRGPRVLTDNGFEWLARFWSDPKRLFGRYVVGNPAFVVRVLWCRIQRVIHLRRHPH